MPPHYKRDARACLTEGSSQSLSAPRRRGSFPGAIGEVLGPSEDRERGGSRGPKKESSGETNQTKKEKGIRGEWTGSGEMQADVPTGSGRSYSDGAALSGKECESRILAPRCILSSKLSEKGRTTPQRFRIRGGSSCRLGPHQGRPEPQLEAVWGRWGVGTRRWCKRLRGKLVTWRKKKEMRMARKRYTNGTYASIASLSLYDEFLRN